MKRLLPWTLTNDKKQAEEILKALKEEGYNVELKALPPRPKYGIYIKEK